MQNNCPGRYCGLLLSSGIDLESLECSACPSGFRTNSSKFCVKCISNPSVYDWLYLGFMFTLPLFLHWLFIGIYFRNLKLKLFLHCASAFVENALAIIVSLLLFEPIGTLGLISCHVLYLSDWYTIFYNPTVMYSKTLYCAQEAVYPLYSIVFVCFLFSLLFMIVFRALFTCCWNKESVEKKQIKKVFYAAMYFHPVLIIAHALLAGLVYYSYPYIIILIALLTLTIYVITFNLMSFSSLCGGNQVRHWLIIILQFGMLSYALIAIINSYLPKDSSLTSSGSLPYLVVVIFPFFFLMLTEKLTYPDRIEFQMA